MDDLDLVTVYTIKNAANAEIIKNALEAEGIPCRLDNESQAGLTGIFDIAVLVRAADEARARDLILAHEALQEDEHIEGNEEVEEDYDE
jgi:hypothetical protein